MSNATLKQVIEHWHFVEPLLAPPQSESQYDEVVAMLDQLLTLIGDEESHPLSTLAQAIGNSISIYDAERFPISDVAPHELLRYLMAEHRVARDQLPEVGTRSVVSDVLAGKRPLNMRQIRALSNRFKVPLRVFI
ncbi:helix-turn-helix domain-containing protein [Pseudomonas panipatensis]|uniref:helix-turn-helix domain-containing protein n=1 Tax=Pseudomonas panipatensis TaxID=428992 RepID=UPI00147CDDAD|nr:transcriptional regulator [Pseudomonas panipatensis]